MVHYTMQSLVNDCLPFLNHAIFIGGGTQYHGFNAGALGLLQNINVCDEVTPVNVEDNAMIALSKTREKTNVKTSRKVDARITTL